MSVTGPFGSRVLRLGYFPVDARVVDPGRARLERHLAQLGGLDVQDLKSVDGIAGANLDLLIVGAQTIPEEEFPRWLKGFKERVKTAGGIWTPAVILANLPFAVLNDVMAEAVQDNWYFDILAADHMGSLPIRVANLLRIHDHLHELGRYAAALDDVSSKVRRLEAELESLKQGKGGLR